MFSIRRKHESLGRGVVRHLPSTLTDRPCRKVTHRTTLLHHYTSKLSALNLYYTIVSYPLTSTTTPLHLYIASTAPPLHLYITPFLIYPLPLHPHYTPTSHPLQPQYHHYTPYFTSSTPPLHHHDTPTSHPL